jgi:hypothetical protein
MPSSRAVRWVRGVRERLNRAARSRRPQSAATDFKPRRDQEDLGDRLGAIEKRLTHLEAMIEGLQDAVHREAVRQEKKIEQLQRDADPSAIRRALGRDAREHGL